MSGKDQLKEGMTVRSSDGEKLGKIFALGATELQIEKGIFFKKDYFIGYDRVLDVRNGECFLALRKDELDAASGRYIESFGKPAGMTGTGIGTERTMELREEELEIEIKKRPVVKEEVRIRAEPVEEQRTYSAETRREVANIEGESDLPAGTIKGDERDR